MGDVGLEERLREAQRCWSEEGGPRPGSASVLKWLGDRAQHPPRDPSGRDAALCFSTVWPVSGSDLQKCERTNLRCFTCHQCDN